MSIITAPTTSMQTIMSAKPNITYMRPNGFKFLIGKFPNITYTCQSASLPEMTLGHAIQQTPFVDISHPGDKVEFGDFTIRFLVNEDMSNYREIYDWIASIGVPAGGKDWTRGQDRASVWEQSDSRNAFSDATLIVVGSNNRPLVKVTFEDVFPISLQGLEFDITQSGMEYFVGTATFRYKIFTIESLI